MRGVILVLVLAGALLAGESVDAPAKATCHPTITQRILRANLDRDRELEIVNATNVNCAHDYALSIDDRCAAQSRHYPLPGLGRQRQIMNAEANAQPDGRELFYAIRDSTKGIEGGAVAVLHLASRRQGTCPTPKYLFLFRPGQEVRSFEAQVDQFDRRYAGREVWLREVLPSRVRVRFFRYDRRVARYIVYATISA
jgi:hypothetical protein